MFKSLRTARQQQNKGRYIQEEKERTLDEVIELGIEDLKERLSDQGRFTVQDIIERQKRELSASVSTSSIQVIDRTAIYTKNGRAQAPHIEMEQKRQGITHHLSRGTCIYMNGYESAAGVLLKANLMSARDGAPSSLLFSSAAGVGSQGFSSGRALNTTRSLPAKLEPLFFAFINYHEEGHALDELVAGDEKANPNYHQIFAEDLNQVIVTEEKLSGTDLTIQEKSQHCKAWLNSLCETRQDVYGILKTATRAKEAGYSKEDMLALTDYLYDSRLAVTDTSIQKYTVHKGIDAARRMIELDGLDAADSIAKKWGEPTTPQEKRVFDLHDQALHFGVRNWVYERELYMDGESYAGLHYQLRTEKDLPTGKLNPTAEQKISQTLAQRDAATQRLRRPMPVEHVTLEDVQSLNAIIARQSDPSRQALELTAMSDRTCQKLARLEGNGHLNGVEGQFFQSQNEYLNATVIDTDISEALEHLPEPTQDFTAPVGLMYIDKLRNHPDKPAVLVSLIPSTEAGTFELHSMPIPQAEAQAELTEEAFKRNLHILSEDDAIPVKTMIAAAHHYQSLSDSEGLYEATQLDIEIDDKSAHKGYVALNRIFDGKEHMLNVIEKFDQYLDGSDVLDTVDPLDAKKLRTHPPKEEDLSR